MQQVSLRILTDKSILGFGKYSNLKLRNIIDCDSNYLLWIYFNVSRISFHKSVIKELGIKKEHFIEKPGMNIKCFDDNYRNFPQQKRKYGIGNWELISKAMLESRNHGKRAKFDLIEGGFNDLTVK